MNVMVSTSKQGEISASGPGTLDTQNNADTKRGNRRGNRKMKSTNHSIDSDAFKKLELQKQNTGGKKSIAQILADAKGTVQFNVAKKMMSMEDLEKYCQPQQLSLYDADDSGFKYNIIGLFGIPQQEAALQTCVFTVLASVLPPGGPYKVGPNRTMFGAHIFADADFDKTKTVQNCQIFQEEQDVELPGSVLKVNSASVLVYDIKKMDLRTGKMTDYGFAIQPLVHTLKLRDYLIGGRYQMPVY